MGSSLADIPVVILAGGRGARFDHESQVLPKPMIGVAGKPILQHIIDGFVAQGFMNFIVAGGHLHEHIVVHMEREYGFRMSHTPVNGGTRWAFGDFPMVQVVDTGQDSDTGERIHRLRGVIQHRRFILTYGDGLSDVRMEDVLHVHEGTSDWIPDDHPGVRTPLVTLTAVWPPGRFGVLEFSSTYRSQVLSFKEKGHDDCINGGFMVCEPTVLDRCAGRSFEQDVLPALAEEWQLRAYRHGNYWRCMDTRRDLEQIEADVAANGGRLPWRHDV